jgi:hypothetical protein
MVSELWAGVDAGKREHHCVVIDDVGTKLFSKRVGNEDRQSRFVHYRLNSAERFGDSSSLREGLSSQGCEQEHQQLFVG